MKKKYSLSEIAKLPNSKLGNLAKLPNLHWSNVYLQKFAMWHICQTWVPGEDLLMLAAFVGRTRFGRMSEEERFEKVFCNIP